MFWSAELKKLRELDTSSFGFSVCFPVQQALLKRDLLEKDQICSLEKSHNVWDFLLALTLSLLWAITLGFCKHRRSR